VTALRLSLLLAAAAACLAQSRDAAFERLADRYFDEVVFKYDPAQATQAGFHQYDNLMPTGSRSEVDAQVAALKKYDAEVRAFPSSPDRDLLLSQIHGSLLAMESIRMWEKNPDQ
jgi:hypothetical protein